MWSTYVKIFLSKVSKSLRAFRDELMLIFQNEYQKSAYAHFEHKHLLEKIRNFEKWILRVKLPLGSACDSSEGPFLIFQEIKTARLVFSLNFMKKHDLIYTRTSVTEWFRTRKLVSLLKKIQRVQKTHFWKFSEFSHLSLCSFSKQQEWA